MMNMIFSFDALPFLLVTPQAELWLTLAIGVLLCLSLLASVKHKHLHDIAVHGRELIEERLRHWLESW